MPNENEELIRRATAGLGDGDLDAFLGVLADDAVMHIPGRGPFAGDHRGREAIAALLKRQTDALGGNSPTVDIHDVIGGDNHVVLLQSVTFERGDSRLEDRGVLVFHVRDGKAADVWVHPQDQYASDEFWQAG